LDGVGRGKWNCQRQQNDQKEVKAIHRFLSPKRQTTLIEHAACQPMPSVLGIFSLCFQILLNRSGETSWTLCRILHRVQLAFAA
jgi:hypothetical protein